MADTPPTRDSVETPPAGEAAENAPRDPVAARIAKLQAKHERELSEARSAAVRDFRGQHGLSDETLASISGSALADLHRALAQAQSELGEFKAREAQAKQEARDRAVRDTVLSTLKASGLELIDGEDVESFALGVLGKGLTVGDDGKVALEDGGDVAAHIRQTAEKRLTFVLKPSAPRGGAGSRPPPTFDAGAQRSEHMALLGEVPVLSESDQRRELALWARGRR